MALATSEIRTDVLQNGVARILLEAVMKLASLTESRLFVLVENHEGGRQFAGSRHLTQAFRQGGIAPHSTDTEVQIELATVRHQTTLPAASAASTASSSAPSAHSGVRRPAPREALPAHQAGGAGGGGGVKRLKMTDGTEHQTVLEQQGGQQVGTPPAAALHSLHSPANSVLSSHYGQHFVPNNKASDWSSANLQTVQFDEVAFQPQHHQSPQQQQQQHHEQRSLGDDTSDSCIPEEMKKTWQEHRAALKERSPRQLARLERERRKRENMSDAEREMLRRKQALQARERRRNMSQALSLARRDQDVEYEIEERARLCGARYDPPIEGETLQEQRNRRANNRRRVKFAENKLDAVGLGNFEVKPIDVHESSL